MNITMRLIMNMTMWIQDDHGNKDEDEHDHDLGDDLGDDLTYGGHGDHKEVDTVPVGEPPHAVHLVGV